MYAVIMSDPELCQPPRLPITEDPTRLVLRTARQQERAALAALFGV